MKKNYISINLMAYGLMKKWGLDDWGFGFSKTTRRIGDCNWRKKIIRYSSQWRHLSWVQIKDVLLHEIAHALELVRFGSIQRKNGRWIKHGERFKDICIEVGAIARTVVEDAAWPEIKEVQLRWF